MISYVNNVWNHNNKNIRGTLSTTKTDSRKRKILNWEKKTRNQFVCGFFPVNMVLSTFVNSELLHFSSHVCTRPLPLSLSLTLALSNAYFALYSGTLSFVCQMVNTFALLWPVYCFCIWKSLPNPIPRCDGHMVEQKIESILLFFVYTFFFLLFTSSSPGFFPSISPKKEKTLYQIDRSLVRFAPLCMFTTIGVHSQEFLSRIVGKVHRKAHTHTHRVKKKHGNKSLFIVETNFSARVWCVASIPTFEHSSNVRYEKTRKKKKKKERQ